MKQDADAKDLPQAIEPASFIEDEPEFIDEPAAPDLDIYDSEDSLSPVHEPLIDPASMPVKSLPISREDLQHVADKSLDASYDEKLLYAGDDLMPIPNGEKILADQFGVPDEDSSEPAPNKIYDLKAGSNKAFDIAKSLGTETEESTEMPVLPENPTEDDLRKYAENHPAVKNVLKLFRGKVVGVRKK